MIWTWTLPHYARISTPRNLYGGSADVPEPNLCPNLATYFKYIAAQFDDFYFYPSFLAVIRCHNTVSHDPYCLLITTSRHLIARCLRCGGSRSRFGKIHATDLLRECDRCGE